MASATPVDTRGVRRLFQYAVLFALMIILALGIEGLLQWTLGALHPWQDGDAVLSRSLAFTLAGGPLAALLVWWTLRSQSRDPGERDTFLFSAYVTLTALVALLVATEALSDVLADALSGTLRDDGMASVVAWAALWLAHWIWARRALDARRNTPHLLLGSLIGLVTAAIGFVRLLGGSLELLLGDLVAGPSPILGPAAAAFITGVLVWIPYWLLAARHLPRRTLWLVHVLPVGVGTGMVLVLVATSRLLWRVAVWFLGDSPDVAAQHFQGASSEVAAIVLGALLWWYHRSVLGDVERTEVRRAHEYLVAGLALAASAVGTGTVVVALIEAATPGADVGMTSRNTLLAALTLLVVGTPVWWLFWSRIQRATHSDPQVERGSRSRRVYLVVLFGVSGVAVVVAVIIAGVQFFDDAVAGALGASTVRSLRYGLGTIVAAVAVFAHHLAVFRADRRSPAPQPRGPRSVLLIGAADDDTPAALAEATGARVELWARLDQPELPSWDVESLAGQLATHAGRDVVVVAGPGGPTVMGVRR